MLRLVIDHHDFCPFVRKFVQCVRLLFFGVEKKKNAVLTFPTYQIGRISHISYKPTRRSPFRPLPRLYKKNEQVGHARGVPVMRVTVSLV